MTSTEKFLYIILYLGIAYGLHSLFLYNSEWLYSFVAVLGANYLLKGWGIEIDAVFGRPEKRDIKKVIVYFVAAFLLAAILGAVFASV